MSSRSLNRVTLIGNLTRDPELKYTPQGTAICSFGLATNREWTDSSGQKQEGAEFHRVVAWGKLGEICSQLLQKGRKAFVEGRLQTRTWKTQDGTDRQITEVVAEEMIALDQPRGAMNDNYDYSSTEETHAVSPAEEVFTPDAGEDEAKKSNKKDEASEVADEIPF